MENELNTSGKRYPFFFKRPKVPLVVSPNLEASVERGEHQAELPGPSGVRSGNECCAPGMRLPGCSLDTEIARIRAAGLRERIIRNVIACSSRKDAEEVVQRIRETVSGAGFGTAASWIAVAAHPVRGFEHVHVTHDCRYGGSTCKCAFLSKYRVPAKNIDFESNFPPFIRRKTGSDLRPIYGEQVKNAEDHYISNLLK